jgi:hypothetical protein
MRNNVWKWQWKINQEFLSFSIHYSRFEPLQLKGNPKTNKSTKKCFTMYVGLFSTPPLVSFWLVNWSVGWFVCLFVCPHSNSCLRSADKVTSLSAEANWKKPGDKPIFATLSPTRRSYTLPRWGLHSLNSDPMDKQQTRHAAKQITATRWELLLHLVWQFYTSQANLSWFVSVRA